jgi:hypothetical protein
MPRTALVHFREDVARARAIIAHADPLAHTTDAERMLRSDLFRSAWMFAVGALDAYFCDAYTDIVAVTIISKSLHPAMTLPDFFNKIAFPVRAILESYARNTNWRWRMAARELMVRENVLKLERIQQLFNGFFRDGHKLYADVMDAWIVHPDARKRLFGISTADYMALTRPEGKPHGGRPGGRWRSGSSRTILPGRSFSAAMTASTTATGPGWPPSRSKGPAP